jgi:hypothetical protein
MNQAIDEQDRMALEVFPDIPASEAASTQMSLEEASEVIASLKTMLITARTQRDGLRAEMEAAVEMFKAADAERLDDVYKAQAEANKWKAEGDMYGWNFHQGMSSGMTSASIIFNRVFRRLKSAIEPQA